MMISVLVGVTRTSTPEYPSSASSLVRNSLSSALKTPSATNLLKPYVIFIKPPSKDQIAKNLIREDKQLNESDIEQMITSGRIIETDFGHLFDEIIINLSQDQTQRELRRIINRLETMPQWVPVSWIPDGVNYNR